MVAEPGGPQFSPSGSDPHAARSGSKKVNAMTIRVMV
jgi:hypothetical protein